ncbi:MAG: hypothetical protein GY851_33480 [bacterium]|nr:hypothetical protein [bacterium]
MPLSEAHQREGHHVSEWSSVLELDTDRNLTAGSTDALCAAIGRGADLRIYTEFAHNEHIDTDSDNPELIQEVSEFRVTYLIDQAWSTGIMTLRQPIELPEGFGPRPSMSFFLYNQDGRQAIARPHLDGPPASGQPGASPPVAEPNMPKYHIHSSWDADTNAPSTNFVYDFGAYRFCVSDTWCEVLSHDAQGSVTGGSLDDLIEAFRDGYAMKVGIQGLCADLADGPEPALDHEVFVEVGPGYYYTEQRLFMVGSHPIVRVRPAIPMAYSTNAWDFGWLMVRTDGHVVYRRCDPYALSFEDIPSHYGVRWFVR